MNKGDGKKFNRHILNWYAYRIFKNPDVEIKAFISIPFNPYNSTWEKGDGGRSKPLIIGEDIITDRDFWKILSGSSTTYDDILKAFKEVGKENLHQKHRDIIYGDYEGGNFLDISNICPTKEYTAIDLFSGAGGVALGLEEAGFKSMGLVEWDKYAASTLRLNRPEWNVIQGDLVEIAEKGIRNYIDEDREVDLLSGKYLCQAFSYVDKKLGIEDLRGTMFYYYAKILKELMPKVFLAESVKRLVSHDGGNTLKTMIDVFTEIGYNVEYKTLKAVDYGVAQKRDILIIIGTRKDLSNAEFKFPKPFGYVPTLRDALKDVPQSEGSKYPDEKKKVLGLVPPGGCWVDLPEEIAKEYMGKSYYSGGGKRGMARRVSWDEPCPTLTCNPSQRHTEMCHPGEIRPFTTREYARIQSFPDDWRFEGSVSQVYKQIGNAVPVKLAKAIGVSIVDYLNTVECNK